MPAQSQQCRCGCGNAATFTSGGESFFARPCRQRFYRHTIRAAKNGDVQAQAYVKNQGWNIDANIGGRTKSAAPKPAAPKPVAPKPAAARRVAKPRIPKIFADFLAGRCKSVALAAKVLGITPKPPLRKSVVRSAWISLISVHHPDKGGAVEAAQAVNAAYQLLEKFSN